MDIQNINDNFRVWMLDVIDSYLKKGYTLEKCSEIIRDILYEMESSDDKTITKQRENYISLFYLDSMKMLVYLHKCGIVNDETASMFKILSSFDSTSDLFAEVSVSIDLFAKMIIKFYEYADLNHLSKVVILKSLSNEENNYLKEITPMHLLDMLAYNRKVTIKDIIEELTCDSKYQNLVLCEDNAESSLLRMNGIIHQLIKYDGDNAIELLLEIAKVDYAVSSFLSTRIEDNDLHIDHVDLYENYSLDDIIYTLMTSQPFLEFALWSLYELYIDGKFEDIKLDDTIFKTEKSNKIEKKLKLK